MAGKQLKTMGVSALLALIERIPKAVTIPGNNLLALAEDPNVRVALAELLRHEGTLNIIPVITPRA